MATQSSHLDEISNLLKSVIQKAILKTGKINLTDEPKTEKKDIIEYDRKMRASGLEKFNAPAYVSAVSFYKSQKELETHMACGAFILMIADEFTENLMKALNHSGIDDAPEEEIAQKCGEFLKTLAEQFKEDLGSAGYRNLVVSEPVNGRNELPFGVEFSYDQYEKSEISFTLKTAKILVAEVTMTAKK